jgi:hypothetical protein
MKFLGPWELYDIEADRTEQHNVVDEHRDLANELIAQWEAWAKRADVDQWEGKVRNDWGEELKDSTKAANKDQSATRQPTAPSAISVGGDAESTTTNNPKAES